MAESRDPMVKFVGVEASFLTLNAVCIDGNGAISGTHNAAFDPAKRTIPQLIGFINELKNRFGIFEKIGVAVPGLIHRETHRVAFSTNIPEHSQTDLTRELQDETGLSALIENDANAAAYGEFKFGAGRGSSNMFYATLGTGVGGAFIFDGKIWRGTVGYAGEFGYVPINSDGMRLEEVASSANIVRRTRDRFHQDRTSSLNKLDEQRIRISDIVTAAEREDDFAQMMLERTGEYVGTAIASVINLLNIEKIVIGGEIMLAKHLVLDSVISRAKELSFGPSFEHTEIAAGELGENAAAVGAAMLANENQ